jgi:hypothetical protein
MATGMKLELADFTDPSTLKDRTDREIFYLIENGHQDMPAKGERIKPEENWVSSTTFAPCPRQSKLGWDELVWDGRPCPSP